MRVPGDDGGAGSFPTVGDFSVSVKDGLLEFRSSKQRLAHFPAWEHADRDLRHLTAVDVPIGTMDIPYDDADDAWRIVIFEHRGFVYVLEGDEPGATDFPRFFRVPTEGYLKAWAVLIDFYNPIKPLDEVE